MSITEQNAAFVEHFGDLERLCNQIYHSHHGVTNYIDDMKENAFRGVGRVPNWSNILRRLKEVRHKRNQLSHGEVSFSHPYATDQDIAFVNAFYQSILNRTDPLAMLRKQSQKVHYESADYRTPAPSTSRQPISGMGSVTLFLLAFAVILLLLYVLR